MFCLGLWIRAPNNLQSLRVLSLSGGFEGNQYSTYWQKLTE